MESGEKPIQIYDPGFVRCLMARGRYHLERSWEGDFMAALRDFLRVLRITPDDKEAHLKLLEALIAMKQWSLANECCRVYEEWYPEEKEAKELKKKLESHGQLF